MLLRTAYLFPPPLPPPFHSLPSSNSRVRPALSCAIRKLTSPTERSLLIDGIVPEGERRPAGADGAAGEQGCDTEACGDGGWGRGAAVLDTGVGVWGEEGVSPEEDRYLCDGRLLGAAGRLDMGRCGFGKGMH